MSDGQKPNNNTKVEWPWVLAGTILLILSIWLAINDRENGASACADTGRHPTIDSETGRLVSCN
jgi:hypothetical protein